MHEGYAFLLAFTYCLPGCRAVKDQRERCDECDDCLIHISLGMVYICVHMRLALDFRLT